MSLGLKCGTVALVDHDPEWKTVADKTIERLWRIFGSSAKDIQHIGSTSINGIKAKPSIGIVVAADHFESIVLLIPHMEQEGFIITYGIKENECHIVVYMDQSCSVETHSILIVKLNDAKYKDSLCFRDYLNSNTNAAKRYEAQKLEVAEKANNDRSVYKKSKSDFMKQILDEALIWASVRDIQ